MLPLRELIRRLMSNSYFQFQQFTVWHDQCAMKVGTDGTLLGVWAPIQGARRILDIGTGTGLIALLCAQRQPDAWILALDVDKGAVAQARHNVQASPFASRIEVVEADILQWNDSQPYDLIVCNPPFFKDSLVCPDVSRALARHNNSMPFDRLCRKAASLLSSCGQWALVLPADMCQTFVHLAVSEGLYLHRLTEVCTKEGKAAKRVLISLGLQAPDQLDFQRLCVLDAQGNRTLAYQQLTRDFYLKK